MSMFHQAIKQILSEIDRFINVTLKDERLSKSTQQEKTKLFESLQKIYEEYEVLNPNIQEGSSNSSNSKSLQDESRFTSGSTHSHGSHGSEEDGGYSENIPYSTVKALKDPFKLGYLQKKPTDLLEKLSKSKKYCVVHKNILYWFKKPGDKKQQAAVFLTGYEVKDVSQNDKEFVFELFSPKKKCLEFQADNKEDQEEWKKALESGIKFVDQIHVLPEEGEGEESGEMYEDINELSNAYKKSKAAATPVQESISAQQLPSPVEPEQDIYDEGVSMPAPSSEAMDKKQDTAASLPTKVNDNAIINEFEDDLDLIYEDVGQPPEPVRSSVPLTPPPRPPSPPQLTSSLPPPLPNRGPNIPVPITTTSGDNSPVSPFKRLCPKLDIKAATYLLEDYENLFYGMWSCVGDTKEELTFDQGDVIHVLNQDLDLKNWWVGERDGSIGLVPKDYLCPAYELVA